MNIGDKISTVLFSELSVKTAVPVANEIVVVIDDTGKRMGVCFGDGTTELKDLTLLRRHDKVSQTEKEVGLETTIREFSPRDIFDMIQFHGGGTPTTSGFDYTFDFNID